MVGQVKWQYDASASQLVSHGPVSMSLPQLAESQLRSFIMAILIGRLLVCQIGRRPFHSRFVRSIGFWKS